MGVPWYEEAFRHDYLLVYPHRNEEQAKLEVEFALRVCGFRQPSKILDLCCGYGRHSSLLAKKGFQVVGCDLSPELLKCFAERLDGLPAKPRIVRGDARKLPFLAAEFGAVFSFFQSFGYFESPVEDGHMVEEIGRVLRPDGCFLLDLMNPDFALKHLEPVSVSAAAGMKMVQRRRYDAVRGKIIKTITVSIRDREEKSWCEEVRLYRKETLEELFRANHLEAVEWFGDFDGRPFSPETPRMIALARKKLPSGAESFSP